MSERLLAGGTERSTPRGLETNAAQWRRGATRLPPPVGRGTAPVLVALLAAMSLATGCECRGGGIDIPDAGPIPDAGIVEDAGQTTFSDSAIGRSDLSIERVVPSHGSFTGGNRVVLRGSGFTDAAQVTVGGRDVQPADHELIDPRRLSVVVPAGEVGPADVSVTVGDQTVTLAGGYTYDALKVDPERGSTSGGTFLTITGSGTSFADGDSVQLGRSDCTDVEVVSPTRITCRTPPASAGFVDVTVRRGADGSETVAVDAFQYYDTSDPFGGGLGGGAITGSINLTVINATTGMAVDGAFAIVGEDLSTEHQGLTDALGQITFSGPDLVGPLTIHVAKHCFERTSVVAFDASDVTVFLVPWMDPMCGMGSGMPPPGRGRNGSFISGDLVWRGPNEYGPNPWSNVPEARAGWERVAYVYTTVYEIGFPNPDPASGSSIQRVIEQLPVDGEEHLGYPYRIFARPAGLAVYALAGLEESSTGRFVPYVMGVARNVLAGPGETLFDVDIVMDIPLDHYVETELGVTPPAVRTGPDRYRLSAYLDLGGEGLVQRIVNDQEFDVIRRRDASRGLRFVAEPALQGSLVDVRYLVVSGWYTSEFDSQPYTVVVQNGVTAVDETVRMPDFLGIPEPVSPAYGERLPDDRMLRWSSAGGPDPDLHVILMVGGDGNPAWRMFVPGSVREAPIPDLSTVPGLEDISSGSITWVVYAVKIPGFDFDSFTYAYLNDRYWSHYALDYFLAQR